jgi:hypothetical protein
MIHALAPSNTRENPFHNLRRGHARPHLPETGDK